jgi:hypothetical protein
MKTVSLSLPADCEVVGELYDSPDPAARGEDMIEVHLPNGVVIDAGWYPEGAQDGAYRVALYLGSERLTPNFRTRDINAAAKRIQEVAWESVASSAAPMLTPVVLSPVESPVDAR